MATSNESHNQCSNPRIIISHGNFEKAESPDIVLQDIKKNIELLGFNTIIKVKRYYLRKKYDLNGKELYPDYPLPTSRVYVIIMSNKGRILNENDKVLYLIINSINDPRIFVSSICTYKLIDELYDLKVKYNLIEYNHFDNTDSYFYEINIFSLLYDISDLSLAASVIDMAFIEKDKRDKLEARRHLAKYFDF